MLNDVDRSHHQISSIYRYFFCAFGATKYRINMFVICVYPYLGLSTGPRPSLESELDWPKLLAESIGAVHLRAPPFFLVQ